jgi:hypothetical protein
MACSDRAPVKRFVLPDAISRVSDVQQVGQQLEQLIVQSSGGKMLYSSSKATRP